MKKDGFYRLGKIIATYRWWVISGWLAVFLLCIPFAPRFVDPFKAIGFSDPQSESAKANTLLNNTLGYSYNQFMIMYHHDTWRATDAAFLQDIRYSLATLNQFPIPPQVILPTRQNKQIAADQHTAYAVILFKGNQEVDHQLLEKFKATIRPPKALQMTIGGEPIFLEDTKKQTEIDLYKTEYIATPVAIITMLVVFGSVVAASLPILLGGIGALIILMILFFVGHLFSLSVFTLNIALLLGLCLILDYSLLIVNRFRDELKSQATVIEAVAMTQATAGKAVFFSGLAVLVSLSALLLFRINVLFSVGVGGLAAVFVSIAIAMIFLPAILAVLQTNVNRFSIHFLKRSRLNQVPYWHWVVTRVIKKPLRAFLLILALLLFMGYPFLHATFGISDFRILPNTLESRQVFDTFKNKFGENKLSPILVIVQTPHANILAPDNIKKLYDFVARLKQDARVAEVNSIVSLNPTFSRAQYQKLYAAGPNHLPPQLQKFLETTTHDDTTLVTIMSQYPAHDVRTSALIQQLRHGAHDASFTLHVTGASVNTLDVLSSISHTFPYAFLCIVGFTYLVLLILFRSVILPLKAILTTILSLFASYGVLTLVIQQGYLHHVLHFEPQGMLDISLLIIIFCALFGISMDYEVFLLARIKECYEQTGNHLKSIVFGIERSAHIITSAAIVVILICFSFMAADILIVKAFGLGIAVAVFVDAFIIRAILVPATMTLLGSWSWYLPKWLDKILPTITLDPERKKILPQNKGKSS